MIFNKHFFLSCALLFLLFSCKKDKSILSDSVQPAEDALSTGFTSNFDVFCYTKKYDSIASYNGRNKFLGSNLDPYFGEMNVGLYLNANLSASNWNFGRNAKITASEIILVVDPIDYCGDTSAVNNFSIFPLDSDLSVSRVYLSNNDRLHSKTPISKLALKYTRLANGKPALRIPIDTTFSGQLMRDTLHLISNETFLAKYKGFYIQSALNSNSQGIVFKCDLEDDDSGFFIRYTADSAQSFKFDFKGNSSVKYNTVKYNYVNANTNLKAQLNGDTASGSGNLFLKGLGVSILRLYIPAIKSIADSFKVAVNRAEIILNIDLVNFQQGKISNAIQYNLPTKLALIACDSVGKENYILDQINAIDASRYDGGYDATNNRYVFNIARHVQAILSGKRKNYGFYVVVADPDARYTVLRDNYIDRVVLYGSSNQNLKPKFNLSYIKFRNP